MSTPGQPFKISTSFGTPIGPTYTGSTTIQPGANGGNIIGPIDQVVSLAITSSGDQTIYSSDIIASKVLALGFIATLVTAGSGTASVTVKLKAAGTGSADVDFVLTPTQGNPNGVAFPSAAAAGIVGNITSITCTPSADGAVVEVQGLIDVTT